MLRSITRTLCTQRIVDDNATRAQPEPQQAPAHADHSHERRDDVWTFDRSTRRRIPIKSFNVKEFDSKDQRAQILAFFDWWKREAVNQDRENLSGWHVDDLVHSAFGRTLMRLMHEGTNEQAFLGAVELMKRGILSPCLPPERREHQENWAHEIAGSGIENLNKSAISLKDRFIALKNAGVDLNKGCLPIQGKPAFQIPEQWGGTRPMYQAVRQGNTNAVIALLEAGVNPREEIDRRKTALHVAIESNKTPLIKRMLEWKDVNVNERLYQGDPFPIHLAMKTGNVEIVEMILRHRKFDATAVYDDVPLIAYAQSIGGAVEAVVEAFVIRKKSEHSLSSPGQPAAAINFDRPFIVMKNMDRSSDCYLIRGSESCSSDDDRATGNNATRSDDHEYSRCSAAQGVSFGTEPASTNTGSVDNATFVSARSSAGSSRLRPPFLNRINEAEVSSKHRSSLPKETLGRIQEVNLRKL